MLRANSAVVKTVLWPKQIVCSKFGFQFVVLFSHKFQISLGCIYDAQRPGREVNHSPPSGVEVNSDWSCTSSPPPLPSRELSSDGQGKLYVSFEIHI